MSDLNIIAPGASWNQIAQGIAAIVTVLMAICLVPIARLVAKIRTNDLHHLDLKIDEHHKLQTAQIDKVQSVMEVKISEVQKSVDGVQAKLDDHIQWHLNQK